MFLGVWNIRGLNDPMKKNEVRKLIDEHKLSFVALIETKIKEVNKDRVLRAIAPGWHASWN